MLTLDPEYVEQQEALEFSTGNFTQHKTRTLSILWSITP